MKTTSLRRQSHAAFHLHYHLIFCTKYRHKCLTQVMLKRLAEILREVLSAWRCELVEFGGEADHIHFLIEAHPSLDLAQMIANLKTVTSRRIRAEFARQLRPYYWKPYLWNRAYAVISVGGRASLETLLAYIQNQEQPLH